MKHFRRFGVLLLVVYVAICFGTAGLRTYEEYKTARSLIPGQARVEQWFMKLGGWLWEGAGTSDPVLLWILRLITIALWVVFIPGWFAANLVLAVLFAGITLMQILLSGAWQLATVSPTGGVVVTLTGAALVIGTVIRIMMPSMEEKKRRQAAKAEEETRLRWEQGGYRDQMITLGEQSMIVFESMPTHLRTAEQYLDQAEIDFADGAFAPFWDSIENAAKTLGRFHEGVCCIKNNSSRYTELIKKYENTPPIFPLAPQSVSKLGVGTATAERMKAIVRTAQRNFQFAVIYEQRKTNQILVAGFTNLAQALDRMTWQITDSISELASSVDGMTSTLNDSMHAIHLRVDDIAQSSAQRDREASKEASERAAREKKVLDMLDNIQRGRKPLL